MTSRKRLASGTGTEITVRRSKKSSRGSFQGLAEWGINENTFSRQQAVEKRVEKRLKKFIGRSPNFLSSIFWLL